MDLDHLWYHIYSENSYTQLNQQTPNPGDAVDAGTLACKVNMTQPIDTSVLQDYVEILRSLGGTWEIQPYGCHRLGCRNSTAIWWCNTNPPVNGRGGAATTAESLYNMAQRVMDGCVNSGSKDNKSEPRAGYQFFNDNHPHATHTRMVLSYANCDDALHKRPFEYEDQQEPEGWEPQSVV
ncbi:hypothetical protein B0T21DRAFT_411957 [Apiosordaria backusii]|uniref:Uncharacterized protein n=1 Tax=Apiosordaria backusii TaxID=314023 RepID=A0AA40EBD5_9PEZI|nr:hypothetical protein B0T21DRAFT_411957 [Apiosordaria backusii]